MRPGGVDSADAYPSPHALLSRLALRTAHDLNNLIAVIAGHAYLLRQSGGADAESLAAIESAVAGLERLSASLSSIGAPHGGTAAVDLAELARSAAARAGNPEVELDVPGDLPPVVGNADALRTALRALITNAEQAAPGREVRIAARKDGDAAVLSVEDRGPGVPKDAGGRVFEPFFSTRGGGRGTGIGLFVAAAVASAHGSSIRLDDRAGGGTVASIRLKTA